MKKAFIVTGTTCGLGKEIAKLILEESHHTVISLSRRLPEDLSEQANLIHFDMDLSEPGAGYLFPDLVRHLERREVVFINNAAIIEPINNIGELPEEGIIRHVKVNMISPILLINQLVPFLTSEKVTFVNITSGVVNNVIAGWSLYCSTKSAMNAFFGTLAKEHSGWLIKSVDPGVMDTGMQKKIRDGDFKDKARFESFKSEGKLNSPSIVAKSIVSKLL